MRVFPAHLNQARGALRRRSGFARPGRLAKQLTQPFVESASSAGQRLTSTWNYLKQKGTEIKKLPFLLYESWVRHFTKVQDHSNSAPTQRPGRAPHSTGKSAAKPRAGSIAGQAQDDRTLWVRPKATRAFFCGRGPANPVLNYLVLWVFGAWFQQIPRLETKTNVPGCVSS